MLTGDAPGDEAFGQILQELEGARRLEHAWILARAARPDPRRWGAALARMKAAVEASRSRRMTLWQHDPDRVTLRLRFAASGPACAQPGALPGLLAGALSAAGLPVAMGLEKTPRPALRLGHPLPAQVEGRSEWADVVLLEAPPVPPEDLPGLVNAHAPAGLALLQCLQVPNYASPVAELCRSAHWRWPCPADGLDAARARVAAFLASERFEWERAGKTGGQKGIKRVDIRPLLEDLHWQGADLLFRTAADPGQAANPRKLLAAVLGQEIQGLARTAVDLDEDPRLLQADKFQPRLRNMYEDAVLLGAHGNIRIVDEDDDDPVVLG
jgi:radical SAM-linked protein